MRLHADGALVVCCSRAVVVINAAAKTAFGGFGGWSRLSRVPELVSRHPSARLPCNSAFEASFNGARTQGCQNRGLRKRLFSFPEPPGRPGHVPASGASTRPRAADSAAAAGRACRNAAAPRPAAARSSTPAGGGSRPRLSWCSRGASVMRPGGSRRPRRAEQLPHPNGEG